MIVRQEWNVPKRKQQESRVHVFVKKGDHQSVVVVTHPTERAQRLHPGVVYLRQGIAGECGAQEETEELG